MNGVGSVSIADASASVVKFSKASERPAFA